MTLLSGHVGKVGVAVVDAMAKRSPNQEAFAISAIFVVHFSFDAKRIHETVVIQRGGSRAD